MTRKFLLILLGMLCAITAPARTPIISHKLQPELLEYKVMYKWGLINQQAGTASLELKHGKDTYESVLLARSQPWADRIYRVRDTLIGRMSYRDFSPLYYERIAHEASDIKHDILRYDYSTPGLVAADVHRTEIKKGERQPDKVQRMESANAVDMLTSYYYMRSLPFEQWQPGHETKIELFSGKQKELLSIRYRGMEDIKYDGATYRCYHITFIFTSKGGKKSSDDMDAWISADSQRVPIKLEGKLPVGKIQCLLLNPPRPAAVKRHNADNN